MRVEPPSWEGLVPLGPVATAIGRANRARDARNTAALEGRGWVVLRFWEHEDPVEVALWTGLVLDGRR